MQERRTLMGISNNDIIEGIPFTKYQDLLNKNITKLYIPYIPKGIGNYNIYNTAYLVSSSDNCIENAYNSNGTALNSKSGDLYYGNYRLDYSSSSKYKFYLYISQNYV